MKNLMHSISAVFVIALLFAAFAFADASPPPLANQPSSVCEHIDRDQTASVSVDTQVVYQDHVFAIPNRTFRFKGDNATGTAWRTWQKDNFDGNLTNYKNRIRGPDKPPNELFTAVSNNRAREKV